MSRYSGKCDFADSVEICGVEKFLNNCEVYAYGQDLVPLRIESEKDLVPLYPFLTWLSTENKYYLCEKNYIDMHEEEVKSWYLRDIIKEYKKAKRNKKEFNPEITTNYNVDVYKKIIEIVSKKGEKTTLEDLIDIHTHMADYYREEWYNELLRVGWREDQAYHCAYGLRRFIQRIAKGGDSNDVEN